MTHAQLFGAAAWAAPDSPCDQPVFLARFDARGAARARITVCGLGFFELYLNGEKVGGDLLVPAWTSYERVVFRNEGRDLPDDSIHRVYALQYDLLPLPGENELKLWLGGGWYRKWNYGDTVKCCYKIDFPSGRSVVSDDTLQWSPSYILGSEVLHGEAHDYRVGESWRPAALAAPPDCAFDLQQCPADRVIRTIEPKALGGGLYDCGENITGWPVLRLGGPAGARAAVSYAENLEGKDNYGANWRQSDSYVSDGTPREARPRFMWHAFRYFKIEGEAQAARVEVVHADVPVAAHFESNSEKLNWLFDAYVRTQLCNMHCGIPSDCPQYEGRGYTGDGQLACDAALLCVDGRDFYAKWMRDIADGQDRDTGHICYTAPFIPSGGGPGGWGCAIAHVPWAYYQTYGDPGPMREYYPNMLRYLDYLELHSENDLVISEEPGNWCLGDWCCPGGKSKMDILIPPPFVNTYFYVKTLREMIEIARLIERDADVPAFEETAKRKRDAILREYYDPETGDFCENIQGANAFAIDIGLGDARALQNMVAHYQAIGQYDTGIFGTDIVTRVLFDHGYAQLAFDLLTSEGEPSFENMRRGGATTLWEYWHGHRSHSHPMFGAVVRCLFRDLLGIEQRPGTVGYTDLVIAPKPVAGLRCRGYITSALGRVEVDVDCGRVLDVTAPKGVQWERGMAVNPVLTARNHPYFAQS